MAFAESLRQRGDNDLALEIIGKLRKSAPPELAKELTLEEAKGRKIWIEEVQALCVRALRTETQVMVKREDEQAFAELSDVQLKELFEQSQPSFTSPEAGYER